MTGDGLIYNLSVGSNAIYYIALELLVHSNQTIVGT